jgi:hypothetical protein
MEFDVLKHAILTEKRLKGRYISAERIIGYFNERIDAGLRQLLSAEQSPQATGESQQAGSKVVGGVGKV